MRQTWNFTAVVSAFVFAVSSGCSYLPGRSTLAKLGLPSPSATIAASEKEPEDSKPTSKWGNKQASAQSENDSRPGDSGMEIARGRSLERSGNTEQARKVYEEILRHDRNNIEAMHRLGVVADMQKRHGEAEQIFLSALRKQPRNAELLSDLGYCFFLQGRLDKAEAALIKATVLEPTNIRYRNNLGLVLGHQKRYDDALEQFTQAGSEADAYYNLAFVFAAQDLDGEAKECFQTALNIDPQHGAARESLASFQEYEKLSPEKQAAKTAVAESGVRYVPYVEPGAEGEMEPGMVATAGATSPLDNGNVSKTTRSLQLQSRGLLGRHMHSQRAADMKSNAEETAAAQ